MSVETVTGCLACGWQVTSNPGFRCGNCGSPTITDAIRLAAHRQAIQVTDNDEGGKDIWVFPRKGRPTHISITAEEARFIAGLLTSSLTVSG